MGTSINGIDALFLLYLKECRYQYLPYNYLRHKQALDTNVLLCSVPGMGYLYGPFQPVT